MRSRARLLAVLATMLPTLALGCAEATRSGAAHDGYILTRSIAAESDPKVVETENRPYREGEPVTYVESVMGTELRATGRNLLHAQCLVNKIRIEERLRAYDSDATDVEDLLDADVERLVEEAYEKVKHLIQAGEEAEVEYRPVIDSLTVAMRLNDMRRLERLATCDHYR